MGVLGAITAVSGLVSATSSIAGGIAEKNAAERNAKIYDAQAANIQSQKNIVAGQYRNKQAALKGEAVASAAHAGVKVSGSVAQSILQSITQLQIEQSYEQYNLDVQRQKALDEAAFQRQKGRQALMSGFMNAGVTALNSASYYYSKYWNNGNSNTNTINNTQRVWGRKSYKTNIEYGYTGNLSGLS